MTPQPLAGAPKSSFASLGRRWIADADDILNASARDGEEMQKLQGELDKEIAELPRIHRELRIRRNACRPLVRLPVEIIIVIVTLAGNGLEPPEHSEWEHFMGWMKLSQVCHRIRTIILDIAGVWAKHVLAFPRTEAREEILRRTGDDLLDMTVSSPGGSGSDSDDDDDSEDSDSDNDSTSSSVPTISYVLNLLCDGWVRSLKIWAEDDEWYGTSCLQEWIELLSGQPFASLQTLVIEDSDPGQPLDHVPHCLSPNLETIRFKNAFMSWNSLALRRLSVTTEDYYFRPVSQPRFPSPDAFLALLAASPNIEDLSLGSCFPDMSAALEDGIQPFVSLPKLHKVHIKGIVSASCWLWGSLAEICVALESPDVSSTP
ncbi:hypothetical protein OF83DRAFT_1085019 [Amylostereum chailletii]|nr:hypothetical protein OF83DRAFT_1085019 [Amylostereum chailletii]